MSGSRAESQTSFVSAKSQRHETSKTFLKTPLHCALVAPTLSGHHIAIPDSRKGLELKCIIRTSLYRNCTRKVSPEPLESSQRQIHRKCIILNHPYSTRFQPALQPDFRQDKLSRCSKQAVLMWWLCDLLQWTDRQAVANIGAEGSKSSSGDVCELLLHEVSFEE
jgi:hypothetical protein